MDIFLCILKSGVAWVVLLFIATNLMGFIARGFLYSPPPFDDAPTERVKELLSHESQRLKSGAKGTAIFALFVTVTFLYCLFHFWNIYLALAAGILLITRLPDLIWEIRNGVKITTQSQPKGAMYTVSILFVFASLPLTWYALCW